MMNGPVFDIGMLDLAAPVLPLDPDPNVVQPSGDRIVRFGLTQGGPRAAWLAAYGGTPTVRIWVRVGASPGGVPIWIPLNVLGISSFTVTEFTALPYQSVVPAGMDLFIQVTAHAGAVWLGGGLTMG